MAPAGIGSPTPNTQIPCFWCSPRSEHDAILRAFQLQRIARAKLHFVANGLGEDDAAGFVQR